MLKNLKKNVRGFTLIELMIVVAIIGILAAIAIPNFLRYQLRARSGEAAVNLAAIKTSEIAYYGNNDFYLAAAANPAAVSTGQKAAFGIDKTTNADWYALGFKPEGMVYFSYEITADNKPSFSAQAKANLDNDADVQCWLIQVPNTAGAAIAPADATTCPPSTAKLGSVFKASPDSTY